ncbi:hypothetical protein Y032_0084g1754 [Ancylostoma ceylanicum]|uniref:Uncharacterized protein n=1 Tax=Ancylostoma ceylanicum TaxID=53326 RepID=A0A016TQP5_9BILA|nr:hypothetical protein Y032_0084g1754 [Ancylostoma ceylanicum]
MRGILENWFVREGKISLTLSASSTTVSVDGDGFFCGLRKYATRPHRSHWNIHRDGELWDFLESQLVFLIVNIKFD